MNKTSKLKLLSIKKSIGKQTVLYIVHIIKKKKYLYIITRTDKLMKILCRKQYRCKLSKRNIELVIENDLRKHFCCNSNLEFYSTDY